MASGVAVDGGEQVPMFLRPAGSDPVSLGPDLTFEFLVDRDRGLTAHLVVEVTQVGGVLSVVKKAVEREGAGVGGSQPAPDQDDGDQPPFGSGPAVEVRWRLNLAKPGYAYAISKLLGEAAFVHATHDAGIRATVGRFHNIYGPRMGQDHVVPEMALRAMRNEDPFLVPGADQFRSFCFVVDAVEAMVRLMAEDRSAGQIVHIGDDTAETNIADLAKLVCRVAGVSPTIVPRPAPPGSVRRRCPDLSLLRSLTAYEPATPLEEGVQRTVDWYRARYV
jgi:nucleoside-diphosphate-sugar epimerase